MTTEPFALKPPFCLPRPGIINRELRKLLRPTPQPKDAAVLTRALAAFGLAPESGFKRMEGAVRNEPWLVQTRAGKKVLKRYKASLQLQQIGYEHAVLEHLAQRDFPCVRLNHTDGGDTVVEVEGRNYAVIDYLDGYFQFYNYLLLPGQADQFTAAEGRTLGHLHQALEGFTPAGVSQHRFQLDGYGAGIGLDWYLGNFQATLEKANAKLQELQDPHSREVMERAAWMQREVQAIRNELETAPVKRGTIHGDYGPHNLLFKVGHPVVALDFELTRLDWLLVDLTTALSRSTDAQETKFDPRGIKPMLAAYHAVYPHNQESYYMLPRIWLYQVLRRTMVAWGEYVEKGAKVRLAETGRRLERIDWILRFQDELASVDRLLDDSRIALDMAAQAGYTTRNKPE